MSTRLNKTDTDIAHLICDIPQDDPHIKVMLVEDDPATRWIVRKGLEGSCLFATADHVQKAMDLYISFAPDIVFLDIQLPDGTGYDVLDWIMWYNPNAYVVMFSSHNSMDNIIHAVEDGACGFIAKPFSKEDLLHYVHSHAGSLE